MLRMQSKTGFKCYSTQHWHNVTVLCVYIYIYIYIYIYLYNNKSYDPISNQRTLVSFSQPWISADTIAVRPSVRASRSASTGARTRPSVHSHAPCADQPSSCADCRVYATSRRPGGSCTTRTFRGVSLTQRRVNPRTARSW